MFYYVNFIEQKFMNISNRKYQLLSFDLFAEHMKFYLILTNVVFMIHRNNGFHSYQSVDMPPFPFHVTCCWIWVFINELRQRLYDADVTSLNAQDEDTVHTTLYTTDRAGNIEAAKLLIIFAFRNCIVFYENHFNVGKNEAMNSFGCGRISKMLSLVYILI